MLVSFTPAISTNNYNRKNTASKQNPNFGKVSAELLRAIKEDPGEAMNNDISRAILKRGKDAYEDIVDTIRDALERPGIFGPRARVAYKNYADRLEALSSTGN